MNGSIIQWVEQIMDLVLVPLTSLILNLPFVFFWSKANHFISQANLAVGFSNFVPLIIT